MAVNNARSWSIFKMVRVLVLSVSTMLSIGFTAVYAVLLVRGWTSYDVEQRTVVIVLVTIDALSSVMFYLMLIFRFRLWLDGIRIAILLFFQVGGTVALALFNQDIPCNNLGSVSTCKTVQTAAIYGSWSLSGLLLLFAFYLAAMSYIPEPKPRPNPEALLALSLAEKREKRFSTSSFGSDRSAYSQKSYVGPLQAVATQNSIRSARPYPVENGRITPYSYIPATPQRPARPVRTPSIPSIASTQMSPGPYNNYYRSATPAGSVRSMAPSTVSNIRASTRQRYYISNRIPAPRPRAAQQLQAPQIATQQYFTDPVSRQGTPMSVMSNQSQYAPYQMQPGYSSPPPGLGYVGNGLNLNFPQPPSQPGYSQRRGPAYHPPRVTSPLASPVAPVNNSASNQQQSMAMQMREALMMRTPSPLARSLDSPTSPDGMHAHSHPQPSRNPSVSSVPRSPSPQHGSFSNLPVTPLSAVLPAHPVLPPSPARFEGRNVQRYGASLDTASLHEQIGQMMVGAQLNGEYRTGSAPPPNNWATSNGNRMDAVNYWRQQATEPRHVDGGRRVEGRE